MHYRQPVAVAVISLLTALLVSGCCGELTRVQECNSLIETVNSNQFDFNSNTGDDPKAFIKELKALADKAEEASKSIENLGLTDPKLVEFAREYRSMLDGMSKSSTDMAKAVEAMGATADEASNAKTPADVETIKARLERQQKEIEALQKGFDEAAKREDAVVDSINGYCTP